MSKANKTTKDQFKTKKKNSFFNSPDFLYFAGTIFAVFLIYSFSLFRPWLPFDESLIYKEVFFPIPAKFEEISEIISTFIINSHITSMNIFFSNHVAVRSNPLTFALIVFISFFFKKHAILWHLLQLSIHLLNVALVFLVFKRVIKILDDKNEEARNTNFNLLTIVFFTLLWGIHSANTEAILLVPNLTAVLTYTFCFLFILYELNKINSNNPHTSKLQLIFTSILFLILMFLTEYAYTLPLIIFFIFLAVKFKTSGSLKDAALYSIKISSPYFIGLFLFVIFSFLLTGSTISNLLISQNQALNGLNTSGISLFIQRNLWLSPQLFVSFLKALLFPKTLSLYQSNLVPIAENLFTPYSIFCTTLYFLFLLLPILLFFLLRKKTYGFICLLTYAFYFAMFPFLHIVMPAYCLLADRYIYFPSFVFLFIFTQIFYQSLKSSGEKNIKLISIILSCILLLMSIRTLVRIQDWNNPTKMLKADVKLEKNPLYKGQRLMLLADRIGVNKNQSSGNQFEKSLVLLSKALKQYKIKLEQNPSQPITLKHYGLDYESLLLKTAYLTTYIKFNKYKQNPKDLLTFFEPYIENNLNISSISPIVLYSQLLLKAGLINKAKKALEYGYKRFDFSSDIADELANLYLFYEKDPDKGYKVLEHAYSLYPNDTRILNKLLKYYEQKHDLANQARIGYLLGLREHLVEGYQIAVKNYLDLNQLQPANKALRKLIYLKNDDPLTLLLTSRYLDLTGQRSKILEVLNAGLILSNKLGDKQDTNVTKSILVSLINVNASLGNISNAKQYLSIFEKIKDLTPEDRLQIQATKKIIEDIENKQALKSVSNQ